MQFTKIQVGSRKVVARIELTDFNRLRWAVAAIRSNQKLYDSLSSMETDQPHLVDSTCLLNVDAADLSERSHVILWDGLNSLIELWQAKPLLKYRHDLVYLHVGHFMDVADAFPVNSMSLFSRETNEHLLSGGESSLHVPAWIDIASKAREYLRPLRNRQLAPVKHKLLQRGGKIAFCGLICPDRFVLDGFFRGTTSSGLRQSLVPLDGLQWQGRIAAVRDTVARVYARIQQEKVTSAAHSACLYSVLNVIHRIGTLVQIDAATPNLFVNEYGRESHFDPYCARDYANNMFLDFGSTRGPDIVYPRSVDIVLNQKPYKSFRLFNSDHGLQNYLAFNSAEDFWDTCEKHAYESLTSLAAICRTG